MANSKSSHGHNPPPKKRIVVCCDGTWENSLSGDDTPLTNVTLISRSLKIACSDANQTAQVVYYHPGVGTGGLWLNSITGGAFGMGLAEDIREAYNFICANYNDGDDIILIGFSRGAFTARSIADLIASIGLLTTGGMTWFYSIFEDYENIGDVSRTGGQFLDSSYEFLAEYNGERGVAKIAWENRRKEEYKQWLKEVSSVNQSSTYNEMLTFRQCRENIPATPSSTAKPPSKSKPSPYGIP